MDRHELAEGKTAIAGGLAYIGSIAAVGAVVATGGGLAAAIAAAVAAGGASGAVGAWLGSFLGSSQAEAVAEQAAQGGLLLWVGIRTPEQEVRAREILERRSHREVELHELTRPWSADQTAAERLAAGPAPVEITKRSSRSVCQRAMSKPIPPGEPTSAPTPAADGMLADLGLRYMSDAIAWHHAPARRQGFSYRAPDGRVLPNDGTKEWIRSLAIPPAWQHVWISPRRDGHLLATGRDAKGRKQYRYHPRWRSLRDEAKFGRMLAFGRALPRIRDAVEAELRKPGLGRRKVLATVVRLLETTLIRVGNDEYARSNKTFGLTTLRNRHVKAEGSELRFTFRGKSGKRHAVTLNEPPARQLDREDAGAAGPGAVPVSRRGRRAAADRFGDVNEFLREIAGDEFTAKDFRTWAGTVLAAWALSEFESLRQRGRGQAQRDPGDRAGGEPARQHAGDLPQELRPSGDRRRLSGRLAAREPAGWRSRPSCARSWPGWSRRRWPC